MGILSLTTNEKNILAEAKKSGGSTTEYEDGSVWVEVYLDNLESSTGKELSGSLSSLKKRGGINRSIAGSECFGFRDGKRINGLDEDRRSDDGEGRIRSG